MLTVTLIVDGAEEEGEEGDEDDNVEGEETIEFSSLAQTSLEGGEGRDGRTRFGGGAKASDRVENDGSVKDDIQKKTKKKKVFVCERY